ncbi:hypothetical protein, partial [Armatimonas sp.]|uniref:hypothetical protein n=1 Tax=Armatimonas sp. TaxID=1872638 RepID=UPI00286BED87
MKRFALILAICLSALPLTAYAQPAWSPRVQVQGAELRVNDVLVLRARSAVGGIAPVDRVQLSAERLRELTLTGLEPREVRVDVETETRYRTETRTITRMVEKTVTRRIKKKRRKVTISVPVKTKQAVQVPYSVETEARLIARGKVIAMATPTEARASSLSRPSSLVESWASSLRRALAVPGIEVSDNG